MSMVLSILHIYALTAFKRLRREMIINSPFSVPVGYTFNKQYATYIKYKCLPYHIYHKKLKNEAANMVDPNASRSPLTPKTNLRLKMSDSPIEIAIKYQLKI